MVKRVALTREFFNALDELEWVEFRKAITEIGCYAFLDEEINSGDHTVDAFLKLAIETGNVIKEE